MGLTLNKKSKHFNLLILLWLVWLLILLYAIKLTIDFNSGICVAFICCNFFIKLAVIYILSLPLTIFVACRGKIKQLKEYGMDIIILTALVVFILFTFYQWYFAHYGVGNLSYETVYGFKEMSAYEYNVYYTATVKAYWNIAFGKIWTIGFILLAIVGTVKIFKKK